jgi:hypothetical protein
MANLIFSRRALQKRLESLEAILTADVHKHLIARLENPGRDRLAAVWEAVMLLALHSVSPLRHESPLADGSRPDFALTYVHGGAAFEIVGDITSVSDKGLHDNNPVGHFWREIVRLARKHQLNPNHFRYDIKSRSDGEYGDSRTVLLLPPRKELSALLKQEIEPFVRGLARDPVTHASLPCSAPGVAFTLTYDQTQRFGGGGHAVYNIPYSRTKTPIYTALHRKADQLRHAPANALRVVIACDADCNAMSRAHASGQGSYSATEVTADFLRKTSAVDIVLLVTTERVKPFDRWGHSLRPRTDFVVTPKAEQSSRLTVEAIAAVETLLRDAVRTLPTPMIDARNAALRCDARDYGLGFHGGSTMSDKTIRISSREVLELLGGTVSTAEFDRRHRWGKASAPNGQSNPFARALARGEMIASVAVIDGEDHDDDWLEFRLGEPDPAISPFQRIK